MGMVAHRHAWAGWVLALSFCGLVGCTTTVPGRRIDPRTITSGPIMMHLTLEELTPDDDSIHGVIRLIREMLGSGVDIGVEPGADGGVELTFLVPDIGLVVDLQAALSDSGRAGIPLAPVSSSCRYNYDSVELIGRVEFLLEGRVAPGAALFVDLGQGLSPIRTDEAGRYRQVLELGAGTETIYGLVSNQGSRRYVKIAVRSGEMVTIGEGEYQSRFLRPVGGMQ